MIPQRAHRLPIVCRSVGEKPLEGLGLFESKLHSIFWLSTVPVLGRIPGAVKSGLYSLRNTWNEAILSSKLNSKAFNYQLSLGVKFLSTSELMVSFTENVMGYQNDLLETSVLCRVYNNMHYCYMTIWCNHTVGPH